MPGYLHYIVTPIVTEEPLTRSQTRRLGKEVQNTTIAVVLDEDITVVQSDQDQIQIPQVHLHRSTEMLDCDWCHQFLARDEQDVPQPDEV